MRIAVVGSGISGLCSAWLLSQQHEVVLFEAQSRIGGHTHTHKVSMAGRDYAVDSGFIVFNPTCYPLLCRLFETLGVASQPTSMTFSVQHAGSGLEYNAGDLDGLFCQRRNLLSPRFLGMVRGILRFYREAATLLEGPGPGPSLGDYLQAGGYTKGFIDDHIVPMASALWSSPSTQVLAFPARYLVQFMANHQMLQVSNRPQWRVVRGGSSSYVNALMTRWQVQVRLQTPVLGVRRDADGVEIETAGDRERFDRIVLACHSDEALAVLRDPSDAEREVLGAITYQANETVLHSDRRILPSNRKAWAAWNAYIPGEPAGQCTVSYCMNLLQGIDSPEPFVVSLNRTADIDPSKIIARMAYAHPLYSHSSVAAQTRRAEISGQRHTHYAGAWWGWGFHEDGMRSAVAAASEMGVVWP